MAKCEGDDEDNNDNDKNNNDNDKDNNDDDYCNQTPLGRTCLFKRRVERGDGRVIVRRTVGC